MFKQYFLLLLLNIFRNIVRFFLHILEKGATFLTVRCIFNKTNWRGVDVVPFRDNAALVHGATKRGPLKPLEVLVEHGAFVDRLDGGGNSPLHCAAYHQHIDSVMFLAQKGCPSVCDK